MRNSRWSLAMGLAAAVAASVPARAMESHPAPSATWKAVAASGQVDALPEGTSEASWTPVRRGVVLAPMTDVRTGRRGRTTLAHGASVIVVDPESLIELPQFTADGSASTLVQKTGTVVYRVDGSKIHDFKVVTPYLVAGVKGTVFLVTVSDRYASVSVERGVVEVRRGDESPIEVHAGETAVAGSDEGAELEIVRDRAAGGSNGASEASPEARKIAEKEQEKLDDHGDLGGTADDDARNEDKKGSDTKDNPSDGAKAEDESVISDVIDILDEGHPGSDHGSDSGSASGKDNGSSDDRIQEESSGKGSSNGVPPVPPN